MGLTPATNKQVPEHAILDHYNKQNYLGNRFVYTLALTSGGTSEVAEIYLLNPAVTTKAFPNQVALFVDLRRISGTIASDNAVLRAYLNPTLQTAGTAQTPLNVRPASATVSVATLQSAPTISANGSLVEVLSVPPFSSQSSNDLYIIDPGQSLLITVQTANSATIDAQISWYEI